jgi:hypothetical protein
MGRRAHDIAGFILLLVVAAGGSAQAPADETAFARLSGKDIRARVIGKTVTDGAHWSDTFDKSGALISWSQGRISAGTWEIRGDELCIAEEAGADVTCYQVWVLRDRISLRLDGAESTLGGYLRSP